MMIDPTPSSFYSLRATARRVSGFLACTAATLLLVAGPVPAEAQLKPLAAAYTATTTGMTPTGLGLRIQVLQWSDDTARADVLTALDSGDALALGKLPTAGYVWPTGSPVGYTVKYAHRTPTAGGGERVTLVTDKPLGSYEFKKWSALSAAPKAGETYSVVELYLDASGNGTGTLSLGAEVTRDAAAGTVTLATGAPNLLANVKRAPAS